MILWILVVIGAGGCVIFGVSFLFDYVYGAQFKKKMGSVPGVIQRSASGWLRFFLLSLAVLAVGLLLMSVCSRRKPASSGDDEFGVTTHEYPSLQVPVCPIRPHPGQG